MDEIINCLESTTNIFDEQTKFSHTLVKLPPEFVEEASTTSLILWLVFVVVMTSQCIVYNVRRLRYIYRFE